MLLGWPDSFAAAADVICTAALCLVLGRIAFTDIAARKISNRDVALVVGLGLARFVTRDISEAQLWLHLGVLAAFLLPLLVLFAAGKLGGGDVKLMLAATIWLRPEDAIGFVVLVTALGAALAIGMVAVQWIERQRKGPDARLSALPGVPYGVAICLALIVRVLAA